MATLAEALRDPAAAWTVKVTDEDDWSQLAQLPALSKLEARELRAIPPALAELQTPEWIDLWGSFEVPEGAWRMPRLHHLWLWSPRMRSLPRGIFQNRELRGLSLGNNSAGPGQLASLPEEIAEWSSLTYLHIDGHPLARLPEIRPGQWPALTSLSLTNLALEELPRGIGGLTGLKELSVHGTPLKTLPAELAGCRALEKITAFNSQIATVAPELAGLPALASVDLSRCQLTEIPVELYLRLEDKLDLRHNRIASIPEALAGRVRDESLEGNPLRASEQSRLNRWYRDEPCKSCHGKRVYVYSSSTWHGNTATPASDTEVDFELVCEDCGHRFSVRV